MSAVLNLLPSRADLLMGHSVTALHHELYREDFGFEPSSQFLEMMRSLWNKLDAQKCKIYKQQRRLILASPTPIFTQENTVDLTGWHNIEGTKAAGNDALCNNTDIRPVSGGNGAPDSLIEIWDMCDRSDTKLVSKLANGRPPLRAYGFRQGDYQNIQQLLEKFIPEFAAKFLESHRHMYNTSLAWNKLTFAEWQYLRDIKSKSPQVTMPLILSTPPAYTIPEENEHFDLWRRDLGFEPSLQFLPILARLLKGINRKKCEIYHQQTVLAKAEEARRKWPPFHVGMADIGFNDPKSCEPSRRITRLGRIGRVTL